MIESLKHELICSHNAENQYKDILIVVHNQLDYTKQCIDSIRNNTQKYKIYVWDNASTDGTKEYLKKQNDVIVHINDKNEGFIKPNNYLASLGNSPYIILLNNDTIVRQDWDLAMLGYLQHHPDTKLVGYMGGILDENGIGAGVTYGENIDFVLGWCMCFPRKIHEQYGLFDPNLEFAFGEDADFSLNLKENGVKIYSLHIDLVFHYGNTTIKEVRKKHDNLPTFKKNHEYIAKKWKHYLKSQRQQMRQKQ